MGSRTLLLLTYYYPPRLAIGSQRPLGLARHLPEFGWQPTVLTVKLPESPPPIVRVIPTKEWDITASSRRIVAGDNKVVVCKDGFPVGTRKSLLRRSVGQLAQACLYFPDPQVGWYLPAIHSATSLLEKDSFDALISTSPPATAHLIASTLKRKHAQMVWLADLRDLWTQNHYYKYGRIRRSFETCLEKRTLGVADCIVTVSQPMADTLQSRYIGKDIHIVTNGFEPADFGDMCAEKSDKFTLVYTGSLYQGKRDPTLLFQAVRALLDQQQIERDKIAIQFYGPSAPWLVSLVEQFELGDIVDLPQPLSRSGALCKQQESTVLLLLNWNHPSEIGTYTGKVFEYLGAQRPIVAIGGPKGVLSQLLISTATGCHFGDGEQIALQMYLLELYIGWRSKGVVPYRGDDRAIEQYTWRSIARQFAQILDRYTSGPGSQAP